jgi:hypothetical protein
VRGAACLRFLVESVGDRHASAWFVWDGRTNKARVSRVGALLCTDEVPGLVTGRTWADAALLSYRRTRALAVDGFCRNTCMYVQPATHQQAFAPVSLIRPVIHTSTPSAPSSRSISGPSAPERLAHNKPKSNDSGQRMLGTGNNFLIGETNSHFTGATAQRPESCIPTAYGR